MKRLILRDGRYFTFGRIFDVGIYDVAVTLSRYPRWCGQTSFEYSVAQHSCYVYDLCPCKESLLHDAHEGYSGFGDVPTPCKNHIVRAVERELDLLISSAFDVALIPGRQDVKTADERMLKMEFEQLFPRDAHAHDDPWTTYIKTISRGDQIIRIEPWTPDRAVGEFLRRWEACNVV